MPTFFVSDERMLLHRNEWDEMHIEKPERLDSILKIFKNNKIFEQCTVIESKEASLDDIYLVHSKKYVDEMRQTQYLSKEKLEEYCSTKEDIYINQNTWNSALLAVGSSISLLENVLKNFGSNGFAAIRPPGHHASSETPCGFCIFNNIAICAKKARQLGVERVLILDWDVHAGQGTQYCIEDDPFIRLISIHRYENGTYWPELTESNVEQPYKNTINVPLDHVGYGDAEYAAILNYFILPIIKDWDPELILVSCGYDAAIGDPEGEMNISPGGYGYLTGTLASLEIPFCLLLEGGYFIDSVARGSLFSMNALIEKSQPQINLEISEPSKKLLKLLFSIISKYSTDYSTFNIWTSCINNLREENDLPKFSSPKIKYKGHRELIVAPWPTRNSYNPLSNKKTKQLQNLLDNLLTQYKNTIPTKSSISVTLNEEKLIQLNNIKIQLSNGKLGKAQMNLIYFYILIPLSFNYKIDFYNSLTNQNYKLNNGLYNLMSQKDESILDETNSEENESFQNSIKKIIYSYEILKKLYLLK